MVTVTRKDIFPGYQLVQTAHAAAEYIIKHRDESEKWSRDSNSIITLSVKNLNDLQNLSEKLKNLGIKVAEFYEPDIENQLTAIALLADNEIRKKLSYLPLALKEFGRENVVG